MRVDCEGDCVPRETIEISDIIDPKNQDEFQQALEEINEQGWLIDAGTDPHDIRFFCPKCKNKKEKEAKLDRQFNEIRQELEEEW
jgi:hypothetical protein